MSKRGGKEFNPNFRAFHGDNSRAIAPTSCRQPPPLPSCLGCGQPFHASNPFCPLMRPVADGIGAPTFFIPAPAMPQFHSPSLWQNQPPPQQHWGGFPGTGDYLLGRFPGTGFPSQGGSQGTGYNHPQVGVSGTATATPSTIPGTEENSHTDTDRESVGSSAEPMLDNNTAECNNGQQDLSSGLLEANTRELDPELVLEGLEISFRETDELFRQLAMTLAREENDADNNKSNLGDKKPANDSSNELADEGSKPTGR